MKSKDKQLEQLIQDFATDYADAKDKYKETLAKVQVCMKTCEYLSHAKLRRLLLALQMIWANMELH